MISTMTRRVSILAVVCAALLAMVAGCGGGGGSDAPITPIVSTASIWPAPTTSPVTCSTADQRTWLRGYMYDQYFWYANLRTPNDAATSLDSYFQSMFYLPNDRYSYTQSTADFNQFFSEGTRTGYGYSLAFADAAQTILKVRLTEPLSPVGLAGLQRGDTIASIDGFTPAQVAAGIPGAVSAAGIPRTFVVRNLAGVTRTFTVSSAVYPLTPVGVSRVLDVATGTGTRKVAYLAYHEFISTSADALAAAFSQFAAAGVTELVVDLRYNGGGSVTVARNVASLMGGSALNGQTFTQLRFNDKHPENNFTYPFTASLASLQTPPLEGIPRVIIIGSPSTASASELVINALKPYRNVVLIGGTTYGKPYGFDPVDACGLTYNTVNFESVNALGQGGYINGITPDCTVADDLDHALGDASEGRLAAALGYIRTGSCLATATLEAAQSVARPSEAGLGETLPPRMIKD